MTVKGMKFGALEFLSTPFDGQKLLDTVEPTLVGDSVGRK
jgi:FixJ family two-component response regulator